MPEIQFYYIGRTIGREGLRKEERNVLYIFEKQGARSSLGVE